MSYKVTLPREVAEAIELARKWGYRDAEILKQAAGHGFVDHELIPLESVDIMTLAKALINGYEVEKSPEELEAERKEKVREYYEFWSERANDRDYEIRTEAENKLDGMLFVLDAYGIKIPGVNADA
jgi:hypothetical protein